VRHFERKTRILTGVKTGILLFGLAGAYSVYNRFDELGEDAGQILASAAQSAKFLDFWNSASAPGGAPAPDAFRAAYYALGRTLSSQIPSEAGARAAFSAISSDYYAILPLAEEYFVRGHDPAAQGRTAGPAPIRALAVHLHGLCLAAAARNLEIRNLLLLQTAAAYLSLFLLMLCIEVAGYYLLNEPFFENLELLRRKVHRSAEPFLTGDFHGSVTGMHRAVDAVETALQKSMMERMRLAREADARQRRLKIQSRALELTGRKVVRLVEELEEAKLQLEKEEKALKITGEKLSRSNKELEQFAYVASHDLKEPLRIVSSFAGLLSRRYAGRLDKDGDDFIRYITEGAQRATDLVSALFNYSRITYSARDFSAVPCLQVLQKALFNLKIAMDEKKAAVTWDPLPVVKGDEAQLIQLFQNLLANALKFNASPQPEFRISCRETADSWVLGFSDNGIGISKEHFERIFLIFQRLHTQDKYPGSGIGLALCKKIAENHGGRIWVDSKPGGGSVFSVELPKTAEGQEAGTQAPGTPKGTNNAEET